MATSTELSLPPKAREIQGFFQRSIGELSKACPKHLTPERMIQVAVVCVYRTPKLQDCEPSSLLASVIQAASLGLDLTPAMGEAYLIPRWNKNAGCNEAQFQPGYRGLAKLARQAGGINYIQAELVRAKDKFEAYRDPDWRIRHEPIFGKDSGPVTHVYAVAKLATGEYQIVVMTTDEIEAIRSRSDSAGFGPWKTDWGEMAKKTAIKRLCKGLPNSADPTAAAALAEAIEADNREYESIGDEHHAKNHDNASGHGSGAYANPADVRAFEEWVKTSTELINTKWLDHNTSRGGLDGDVRELLSTYQLAGHLYKWARSAGLVNAPAEVRSGQRDKFTAIAWVRDREQIEQEALRYGREKWREATAKAIEAKPADDPYDGLTEDNFIAEEEAPA